MFHIIGMDDDTIKRLSKYISDRDDFAHATYLGTGTKTYTKGYTATAEYKGEVKKIINDTVTYTVVFTEVQEKNGSLSYWWAYLLGLLGLGGIGCGVYVLIRKRKKGY